MVTVEATKDYRDLEKSVLFHEGETHEVTEKRAEVLVKAGVVKIVTEESKAPAPGTVKAEKPKKAPGTKKTTK